MKVDMIFSDDLEMLRSKEHILYKHLGAEKSKDSGEVNIVKFYFILNVLTGKKKYYSECRYNDSSICKFFYDKYIK